MKIYKDPNGKVINIGEWEFNIYKDSDKNLIVGNPLPPGTIDIDGEVVTGYDGGLYAYDDPRQFGPSK